MMRQRVWAGLLGVVLVLLAAPASSHGVALVHDHAAPVADVDRRAGVLPPTRAQRVAVERAGWSASWNRSGTPRSLTSLRGWLATGLNRRPAVAARQFLARHAGLFGLRRRHVRRLELLATSDLAWGAGHAVLLRQRFGGLSATRDGLVTVAVSRGRIAHVSSSLVRPGRLRGARRLSAREAWVRAARDLALDAVPSEIRPAGRDEDWTLLRAAGFTRPQRARLVALPSPRGGARRAYEVLVLDEVPQPVAATVFVDAATGAALVRHNRLDLLADEPRWRYFTANPPFDSSEDTRILACFPEEGDPQAGCQLDLRTTERAAPAPWDTEGGGPPTGTTTGNNAETGLSPLSPFTPDPGRPVRPTSPTRDYDAPFTDAWRAAKCNPSVFAGGLVPATGPSVYGGTNANDVNAAIIALFANHNRMHDWSYQLGFTEENYNLQVFNYDRGGRDGDPEVGNAQAGAVSGGYPAYLGRDNANQITPNDGVPGITNMYLWQPISAAFYPPCVDGDFDMSVIGHEYTHAISNRMVGGPDEGLTSSTDGQARAMGESFSDLVAVEYLAELGYAPIAGENPFAVGPYVTGALEKGIRNYAMNRSPLNYSHVRGYDGSGNASPHDDGEIWSAVNFDIRQALAAKYDAAYPASDRALQRACADGQRPPASCPGNRRWTQIVFDAFLLMPAAASMLDARDAYLAADRMRFGGANQAELWRAFAARGFGEGASSQNTEDEGSSGGTDDPDPTPDFRSPVHDDEATVTFTATAAGGPPVEAEVFVGPYEANVTPIADTAPGTVLEATQRFVPGVYEFTVRADGYGVSRFRERLEPRDAVELQIALQPNHASAKRGAKASGDGDRHEALIDDTERTNWAATGRTPDVRGTAVTVELAGGEQLVDRVNVGAMLNALDRDATGAPVGQNRFTALRQFELQACTGACADPADFRTIFTSPADAFPGDRPRPLAPDMLLREFDVPDTRSTHVRLVVLSNQCTGNPLYQDETQDADPATSADCRRGNPPAVPARHRDVRASELQVFSAAPEVRAVRRGQAAEVRDCTTARGFRSASVRPSRRGLRFAFRRSGDAGVQVDVFRVARGRTAHGYRRVAAFRDRERSFRWSGRGRRVRDGFYVARLRTSAPDGGTDTRRFALRRQDGRFARRAAYRRRAGCGLLAAFALDRPAFGGRDHRALGIRYRTSEAARVTVTVLRGRRIVRRFGPEPSRPNVAVKLRLASEALPRGTYRVRIRVDGATRRATATLRSRRI